MFFSSRAEHSEAVTQFKEGIANFCGMQVNMASAFSSTPKNIGLFKCEFYTGKIAMSVKNQ